MGMNSRNFQKFGTSFNFISCAGGSGERVQKEAGL